MGGRMTSIHFWEQQIFPGMVQTVNTVQFADMVVMPFAEFILPSRMVVSAE
jgi:hypothetical protein